jgi:methionyl-tRNA synthetase
MPRHLITSALPPGGGVGDLGALTSSLLPADAYCRFLRAQGEEVLFVCAGGEGAGASAEAELAAKIGLSFDARGQDSSPQSAQQVQYFARRLEQEGFIETRSTRQLFSPAEDCLLVDRLLVGICPHCAHNGAHGDQCGRCDRLLEPVELIDPRAVASGSEEVERREGFHLFLLQSRLAGELRSWIESCSGWSPLARSIGARWLEEGIGDWGITRELKHGVSVDRTGFEGLVYSARFEAPIAYIGATHAWAAAGGDAGAWRRWWRAGDDVRQVQFMARGEVPFHVVCFPCILIGSREAWKLVDVIKAFDRLSYDAGSSSGAGAGALAATADELPADCWRYFLLATAPEAGEESFSWEALAATVNAVPVADVAGFVDRCLGFARRRFGATVPDGGAPGREERELVARVEASVAALAERLAGLEFRRATAELGHAWALGGRYLERKRPWDLPRAEAALTARVALNLLALLARVSAPVMPFTAELLLDTLAVPEERRGWPRHFDLGTLAAGHAVGELPPLFGRIGEAQLGRWRERLDPAPATLSVGRI